MRTCYQCPFFSTIQMPGTTKRTDRVWLCKSTHPELLGEGCGCFTPYSAFTASPYEQGCWGAGDGPQVGWPAYRFSSWGERVANVLDFILHPPDKEARTINQESPH